MSTVTPTKLKAPPILICNRYILSINSDLTYEYTLFLASDYIANALYREPVQRYRRLY
jgi:hypothetical protein